MTADALEREILEFVRAEYLEDERALSPDTPLVSSGIVDSFSLASLRVFIEEKYGVRIPDERAVPAAFETARAIGELVRELEAEG